MRKHCFVLAAVMLLTLTGVAFACGCNYGNYDNSGHVWRYGDNGYYCDGGYGHGPNCRY